MKVISINIGLRKEVKVGNKIISTGIFKYPVTKSVELTRNGVQNDHIDNLIHHGGPDKACYLFSKSHYNHWKSLFPDNEWNFGMFGENLTIEGLDEDHIYIGDEYQIGNVVVQVSEPRQPCNKLNIRLNSDKAIRQMIDTGHCGTYVRILKEGSVSPDDKLLLIRRPEQLISVREVFNLIYSPNTGGKLKTVINNPFLAKSTKEVLLQKSHN